MDAEFRYLLEQGPTTATELVRLSGKSKSTVYKLLGHPDVVKSADTPTRYSVQRQEAPVDGPGASAEAEGALSPNEQPAVAPAPSTGRGRPIANGGKLLFPHEDLMRNGEEGMPPYYENPRRQNSHGHRSLQIIIDNPGITTEEFLAKGGRSNDLRWDLAHGNVRAE